MCRPNYLESDVLSRFVVGDGVPVLGLEAERLDDAGLGVILLALHQELPRLPPPSCASQVKMLLILLRHCSSGDA